MNKKFRFSTMDSSNVNALRENFFFEEQKAEIEEIREMLGAEAEKNFHSEAELPRVDRENLTELKDAYSERLDVYEDFLNREMNQIHHKTLKCVAQCYGEKKTMREAYRCQQECELAPHTCKQFVNRAQGTMNLKFNYCLKSKKSQKHVDFMEGITDCYVDLLNYFDDLETDILNEFSNYE
mmetsp:Transcript_20759/g.23473  ORF Transcript_20759/g.23473 Transcript_20759/m.23473 type:complete len:181 (+) Transcript_20759:2-544(+)